jgi:hypothetical protein
MPIELRAPTARQVGCVLTSIVASLLLLSVVGQAAKYYLGHPQLKGFVPAFYVDYESNVPTWYSSCALLIAAALLAVIAFAKASAGDRFRWHWALLSLLFVGLSADEVAGFHEYPIDYLRETFNFSGPLYYPWVILGLAFLGLVASATWRMVWSLPPRTRWPLCLSAAVFASGALGIEMLSGMHASQHGQENFTYAMIVTVEEACEMMGVVILICALTDYLHHGLGPIRWSIGSSAAVHGAQGKAFDV